MSRFHLQKFPARRLGAFAAYLVALAMLLAGPSAIAAKKPPVKRPVKIPAGKPEIFELAPRGIQRGVTARIKLIGTNLVGLTELKFQNPSLHGSLLADPEATTNVAWIEVIAATNLARGAYEISVKNTNAESSRLKLYVDDLPQVYEPLAASTSPRPVLKLPFSFWGTFDPPGDVDNVEFEARAGETIVLDVAARSIGSPANAMLTLFDDQNNLIASNNGLDGGDPLLNVKLPRTGRYRIQIGEKMDAGSKDHFYRLSVGAFPIVVGCFPLGVPANQQSRVELIGFNLPPHAASIVKAGPAGEAEVSVDPEKFRSRRPLKVIVSDKPELIATNAINSPAQAMLLPMPSGVNGRVGSPGSPSATGDYYRFRAIPGQVLVVETDAARRGSPMDTKIEVLHPDGSPIERVLLQAVRDSHLTFKNIDSNTDDLRVENWQEMELNQFMYLEGEVCRIFRMPQGPDSGFQFYNSGGKRILYFDTSPVAHALDEPIYIVEPHPPGTKLVSNGLPVFTLHYANDDDASRMLGTDSRLFFTVPGASHDSASGGSDYLVHVTDTRGFSGERFTYRLTIREAQPDFNVTLSGANPTVNAGSGREFSVTADRLDGFDADIVVQITNVPPGVFVSSPIVIQSGHSAARGVVYAAADAMTSSDTNLTAIKVTATALVPSKPTWPGGAPEGPPPSTYLVAKDVNGLGKITIVGKPKLFVALEPYDEHETNFVHHGTTDKPLEITVAPGHSAPAWLKVSRNGHDEIVTFSVENLPHGVIVDNIGLNGVLIPKGENARQIFLSAARWVPDTDCLCFAKSAQAENQTSFPLLLHVRKPDIQASVKPHFP